MLLLPSMMCADFNNLESDTNALIDAGVDGFHLDVIDGNFIPNLGLGLGDIQAICKLSPVPCDVHLMVKNARTILPLLAEAGVEIVHVHPEAESVINSTLTYIKNLGMKCGIVIDPGISFEQVHYALPVADYVLIMTVNPGYAGQSYLPFVEDKIKQFVSYKEQLNYKIIVDGACSPEVIKRVGTIGVDGVVLGTSALFGKKDTYSNIINDLRKLK